jgi:hypothetical protein
MALWGGLILIIALTAGCTFVVETRSSAECTREADKERCRADSELRRGVEKAKD